MKFHHAPHTFVGQVDLQVEDIERSIVFYQRVIGFKILEQTERKVWLTADGITPLLSIEQPEDIIAKQPRRTGLYHFAILLPSRKDLGIILKHMIENRSPLSGGSDHYVSEALYLSDPDGNGIEIYADRPSSSWTWNNDQVNMATEQIDIDGLLAESKNESFNGLPPETVMGHIHLHVADLRKAEEFYTKGLGFDVVLQYGGQALFISTGGYHHHIGLNVWNGIGAPEPAANSVGMQSYTLVLPSEEARQKTVEQLKQLNAQVVEVNGIYSTKDPSGNVINLTI